MDASKSHVLRGRCDKCGNQKIFFESTLRHQCDRVYVENGVKLRHCSIWAKCLMCGTEFEIDLGEDNICLRLPTDILFGHNGESEPANRPGTKKEG